jgi:hypothetical protein
MAFIFYCGLRISSTVLKASYDRAPACDAAVDEQVAAADVAAGKRVRALWRRQQQQQQQQHYSPRPIRAQKHDDIRYFSAGCSPSSRKALQKALCTRSRHTHEHILSLEQISNHCFVIFPQPSPSPPHLPFVLLPPPLWQRRALLQHSLQPASVDRPRTDSQDTHAMVHAATDSQDKTS